MLKHCFFLFLSTIQFVFAQDTLRLPLHFENGYGPFVHTASAPSYRPIANLQPRGEWDGFYKCLHELKNAPKNWKNVNRIDFSVNIYQEVYECYSAGNMTQEYFELLKESWNWIPDENFESPTPMNNNFTIIQGIDENGTERFIWDKNGNYDFSDDAEIKVANLPEREGNNYLKSYKRYKQMEDSLLKIPFKQQYAYLSQGKRIDTAFNFILFKEDIDRNLVMSIPIYAKTFLPQNGKQIPIAASWGFSSPFSIGLTDKLVLITHDSLKDKTADESLIKEKSDFFEIDGQIYQFLGADRKTKELILVKYDKGISPYLPQEGSLAPLFEATDAFGNVISLESLRGKYVLLDFWGTSCKPCIEEMPEMQKLHELYGHRNFVILGIAEGNKEQIAAITQMQGATYAQIMGKDSEALFKKYNVTGLPRTFLINPQGYVMKRNWRSWDFKAKLGKILTD
jgi:peroxiredoxin